MTQEGVRGPGTLAVFISEMWIDVICLNMGDPDEVPGSWPYPFVFPA